MLNFLDLISRIKYFIISKKKFSTFNPKNGQNILNFRQVCIRVFLNVVKVFIVCITLTGITY